MKGEKKYTLYVHRQRLLPPHKSLRSSFWNIFSEEGRNIYTPGTSKANRILTAKFINILIKILHPTLTPAPTLREIKDRKTHTSNSLHIGLLSHSTSYAQDKIIQMQIKSANFLSNRQPHPHTPRLGPSHNATQRPTYSEKFLAGKKPT